MIEIIGGAFAAGETKTFQINGEYLELLEAQYPCDVMLMDRSGAQLSIMRNSEVSFFSKPSGGFQSIQVTSAQAQVIKFFVGSGDAGTRRTSGVVQIVDGEKARTLAGGMFAGAGAFPASAGNYTLIQLWNPAGTGRNVILSQISFSANASTAVDVYGTPTIAASDVSADRLANKLIGSGRGAAQVRAESNTNPFVFPYGIAYSGFVTASGMVYWTPRGGLVIRPGFGLNVRAAAAGIQISANFEWQEETI